LSPLFSDLREDLVCRYPALAFSGVNASLMALRKPLELLGFLFHEEPDAFVDDHRI